MSTIDLTVHFTHMVEKRQIKKLRQVLSLLGYTKVESDKTISDIKESLKPKPPLPPKPFRYWEECVEFYIPEIIEGYKLKHGNTSGFNGRRAIRDALQSGMIKIDGYTADMLDY
jgi:hypothetical protein